MPEIIPFPAQKPEEPKKDITKGEVSKDGRILSWKSDEPVDPGADLIEDELKKHKRKMAEDSIAEENQKSPNVETRKIDNWYLRSQGKVHRRQESLNSEKRKERRFKKDLKSSESELYDRVFER